MTDSIFTSADGAFVPQVLAPIIENYVMTNSKMLATGAAVDFTGSLGWNMGGSTVTRPIWKAGVTAETLDITASTHNEAQRPTFDYETLSVLSKIIPVQMTGSGLEDCISNKGSFNLVVDAVQKAVVTSIDKALIAACEGTTLSKDVTDATTKTLTYEAITDAKYEFGDAVDEDMILIAHSKCIKDLLKSADIKGMNLGAVIASGNVVSLLGMSVYCSDNITVANSEYTNLIVKKGGALYGAKRPLSVQSAYLTNDVTQVDWVWRFVAALNYFGGKEGAVKLITT